MCRRFISSHAGMQCILYNWQWPYFSGSKVHLVLTTSSSTSISTNLVLNVLVVYKYKPVKADGVD